MWICKNVLFCIYLCKLFKGSIFKPSSFKSFNLLKVSFIFSIDVLKLYYCFSLCQLDEVDVEWKKRFSSVTKFLQDPNSEICSKIYGICVCKFCECLLVIIKISGFIFFKLKKLAYLSEFASKKEFASDPW